MNFAKFWAAGQSGNFTSWRWSNTSQEEAQQAATVAARALEAQFQQRGRILDRYGYPDRPFREPILRELRNDAGELAAVVTRNSYGCQVLNTARAMFVDVDLPQDSAAVKKAGIFGAFFRKPDPEVMAQTAIGKAGEWASRQSGWNWRVYRTPAGLRFLATHALFDPKDAITQSAFDALQADRLYRKLCQTQDCFRARLTPKPWRCDLSTPPTRWPFFDSSAEQAFNAWDAEYQAASRSRASCKLVSPGSGYIHPELRPLINLHDEMTRATSSLPLA